MANKTMNCTQCGVVKEYKHRGSYYNARASLKKKGYLLCKTCQDKQVSTKTKGISKEGRKKGLKNTKSGEFHRDCPSCGTKMYYRSAYTLYEANRKNTICNSCSTKKYGKEMGYRLTEEMHQQAVATRQGYETYQDYLDAQPEWKKYKNLVRKLTRQQPIDTLPNSDKPRGLNGVEGAWQLDHIVSVKEGFMKGIPAEEIADISNLQFITWEENITKGA